MKNFKQRSKTIKIAAISIISLVILYTNLVEAGIFGKFYSELERDYLAEVVTSDLKYFDGIWRGNCHCSGIGGYPPVSRNVKLTFNLQYFIEENTSAALTSYLFLLFAWVGWWSFSCSSKTKVIIHPLIISTR